MKAAMKPFRAPDGTEWLVDITNPGSSNALVLFRHPHHGSGLDRYAWYLARGAEARNVTGRLDPKAVLEALTDRDLQRLFRTSFGVSVPEYLKTNRAV